MVKKQSEKPKVSDNSWKSKLKISVLFPYLLVVFGLTGLGASVVISVEKANLLRHPKEVLVCDLNPIYSCSNVITSKQSTILGISNEVFGLIMFSAILTVGVSVLAGAQYKKWFWYTFMAGMAGFSLTVLYLWYQSVFTIGSLCIFCTSVWISGWTVAMSLFSWTQEQGLYKTLPTVTHMPFAFIKRNNVALWLGFILLLAGLTLKHFWYFYGPKLGF